MIRRLTGTIVSETPQGACGADLGFTTSAEIGQVRQATAYRVGFIGGS